MAQTVLVVDDSSFIRSIIRKAVEDEGFKVIAEAGTGEEAIDLAFELQPNFIMLDIILPDMIGLDILSLMKEQGLESKVIMVSALGQECVIREGLRLGAKAYIVKPFTSGQLIHAMTKA